MRQPAMRPPKRESLPTSGLVSAAQLEDLERALSLSRDAGLEYCKLVIPEDLLAQIATHARKMDWHVVSSFWGPWMAPNTVALVLRLRP